MLVYVLFLKLEKEVEDAQKVILTPLSVPSSLHNPPDFYRLCTYRAVKVSQDLGMDLLLCLLTSSNFLPYLHLGYL